MMTFEEYKKQFEEFTVIDTPEKLAICQRQYQMHLLNLEAQNYFEPFEYRTGNDISSLYEKRLLALLPFDKIQGNQLSFLLKPSFEPEGLLIMEASPDKYLLSFTTLLENYWCVLYKDQQATQVERKTLIGDLPRDIGDQLVALVDGAIADARKPESGRIVLDGTVYVLARVMQGKSLSVFKHSPDENCRTGRIIKIFLYLIDNILQMEGEKLEHLERLIADCG